MIAATVVGGVAWLIRLNTVLRRRHEEALDFGTVVRALAEGGDIMGTALLIFLFVIAMYWFSFYKQQKSVYTIIPIDASEFLQMLTAATVMKTIGVTAILYRQLDYDVIFIDWEKPRRAQRGLWGGECPCGSACLFGSLGLCIGRFPPRRGIRGTPGGDQGLRGTGGAHPRGRSDRQCDRRQGRGSNSCRNCLPPPPRGHGRSARTPMGGPSASC